jgi:hypothetical protein
VLCASLSLCPTPPINPCVLGPGHRWPYVLKPFYFLCERLPSTRESARRLGFVTHAQMTAALLRAVEDPAPDFRLLTVPDIRASA